MHYSQELPLVFFTLLAQMAVGIVFVGQCLLPRKVDGRSAAYAPVSAALRKQTLVALVLLGVAALASLSHTGSPLNAFFTLFNVGTSWLSREIALMGVTGLAMLWLAAGHWKSLKSGQDQGSVTEGVPGLIAVAAGLVLIFAMSGVYNQKTTPGWNNAGVLLSFDASMLLLGGLWTGVVLSRAREELPTGAFAKVLALTMLGMVGMAVSLPLMVPVAAPAATLNAAASLPYAELIPWHARHAALTGFGVLFFTVAVLHACRTGRLRPGLTLAAFVMVFAGEVLGRIGFYMSYSRFGM